MRVTVSREEYFVPEWNGNLKQKEADQVKVYFKYLTPEQEERYLQFRPIYRDGGSEIEMTVETNANAIWSDCVTRVEGLYDENDKPITDPKEVVKMPGMYGLITEAVARIKKGQEVDEKNS
jgi:hypothetical protein